MPPVRRQVQSGRTGATSHEIKKSRQESRPWPIRAAVCRVSYAARKGKQIDLKDWRTIAANLGRSDAVPYEKSRRGQQANIKYIVVQVQTSRDVICYSSEQQEADLWQQSHQEWQQSHQEWQQPHQEWQQPHQEQQSLPFWALRWLPDVGEDTTQNKSAREAKAEPECAQSGDQNNTSSPPPAAVPDPCEKAGSGGPCDKAGSGRPSHRTGTGSSRDSCEDGKSEANLEPDTISYSAAVKDRGQKEAKTGPVRSSSIPVVSVCEKREAKEEPDVNSYNVAIGAAAGSGARSRQRAVMREKTAVVREETGGSGARRDGSGAIRAAAGSGARRDYSSSRRTTSLDDSPRRHPSTTLDVHRRCPSTTPLDDPPSESKTKPDTISCSMTKLQLTNQRIGGTQAREKIAVAAEVIGAAARSGAQWRSAARAALEAAGICAPNAAAFVSMAADGIPIPARIEAIFAGVVTSAHWSAADQGDASEHDDARGQRATKDDAATSPRTTPSRRTPTATTTSTAAARGSLREAAGGDPRQPARRRVSFDLRSHLERPQDHSHGEDSDGRLDDSDPASQNDTESNATDSEYDGETTYTENHDTPAGRGGRPYDDPPRPGGRPTWGPSLRPAPTGTSNTPTGTSSTPAGNSSTPTGTSRASGTSRPSSTALAPTAPPSTTTSSSWRAPT
ncbi:unnamed protein product [Prorocentrum cordatum]|uniref:Uncharacterized protein n=1 Tax=Prorocentrum cordatum TaxID=2364126 RepID=A0ABN9WP39_9DINO|nr:unnamed protein product [Polarella glacialis]